MAHPWFCTKRAMQFEQLAASSVGAPVGLVVLGGGVMVGKAVGSGVGAAVGDSVGVGVGASVGEGVVKLAA